MKEQKTKEAMAASLLRFLCRKPLNRITVNDIIQDCGTSRMTFYYHFTDIYDLAKWTCERETDRMIQDHASLKSWQNDFRLVLDTLRKNPEATYHIYHAVDHDTLAPYMHKVIISCCVRSLMNYPTICISAIMEKEKWLVSTATQQ